MHKRFVFNIVSRILLILCLIMCIPLALAMYNDIHSQEVFAFSISIILGIIFSCLFLWQFQVKEIDYQKINAKDGLAIVGLVWILLSALGALPLYLSGVVPTYTDAFFEIVSGFTTTGASIFKDVEILPMGILFWRSLTQWLGGIGIVVLFIAFLPVLGQTTSQLYKAEASGITVEKIEPRLKETARNLWWTYFLLSLLQVAFLMAGGMSIFDSFCHTFATVATGGFSTKNASIGAYSPYIQWVVIVFMFLGGVNFILHYMALRGNPKGYFKNEEFRFYVFLIISLVCIFSLVLLFSAQSTTPVRDSTFQILSILTTTGFVTADFDKWPMVLKIFLLFLMILGGCGGSTAGGLKVIRGLLALKISFRSIMQSIFPNAVIPVRIDGQPLSNKIIVEVLAFFVIYMFLFFTGAVLLIATESCDLVTAFSATITCLSNVGPGLNLVGPTQNYGWISIPGKWVLTFMMLVGRLELYSLLILFLPMTWKK